MRTRELLDQGAKLNTEPNERSPRAKTKSTCQQLLQMEAAMWLFASNPAVEPTNNLAERSLRHAVLHTRVSFGSQSEDGAEWTARLLSVLMTLRARGESVHKFLVQACSSFRTKTAPPSLLPPTKTLRC